MENTSNAGKVLTLDGKYSSAKIFTDNIEDGAINQIKTLLDMEMFARSDIRIMPDVHSGKGCVIGFTAKMNDKIIPNLIGVDIGCGMLCSRVSKKDIDLKRLDEFISSNIPSGKNVNEKLSRTVPLNKLKCYKELNSIERINLSLGTLGGGNHFIEISEDSNSYKYLIIHSGSRNLGHQVASYYQNMAIKNLKEQHQRNLCDSIDTLKKLGLSCEIEQFIKSSKKNVITKDLSYLEGEAMDDYLYDMSFCQEYASLNRRVIANKILNHLDVSMEDFYFFETVHNYIDLDSKIIRKGAVSSMLGEKLLIPINMRDGSLLCVGKGNPDWNYSAPHGAGRIMSRTQAKKDLSLDDFKQSMAGIHSSSVSSDTIDESPMAYKNISEIIKNTIDTVEIMEVLRPIYNFKARE